MLVAPVAFTLTIIACLNCSFMEVMTVILDYRGAVFDDEGNVTHIDLDTRYEREYLGLMYWQCEDSANPAFFEFAISSIYRQELDGDSDFTDDEVDLYPFNVFLDPDYNVQTEEKFRTALAMGFIAVLIGGLTMLFLQLATCISYPTIAMKSMGFGFFLATLFTSLMLTAFSAEMCDDKNESGVEECVSNYRNQTRVDIDEEENQIPLDNVCLEGCRVGPGGGMAIAATILWFVATVFTCLLWGEDYKGWGGGKGDDKESDADDESHEETAEREPLVQQHQQTDTPPSSGLQTQPEQVVFQYQDEQGNSHQGGTPPLAPTRPGRQSDAGLQQVPRPEIVEELEF